MARGAVRVAYAGGTTAVVDGFMYEVPRRSRLDVTPSVVKANGQELPRSTTKADATCKVDGDGCESMVALDGASVGDNYDGSDIDVLRALLSGAPSQRARLWSSSDRATAEETAVHSKRCRCSKHRERDLTPEQREETRRFVEGDVKSASKDDADKDGS